MTGPHPLRPPPPGTCFRLRNLQHFSCSYGQLRGSVPVLKVLQRGLEHTNSSGACIHHAPGVCANKSGAGWRHSRQESLLLRVTALFLRPGPDGRTGNVIASSRSRGHRPCTPEGQLIRKYSSFPVLRLSLPGRAETGRLSGTDRPIASRGNPLTGFGVSVFMGPLQSVVAPSRAAGTKTLSIRRESPKSGPHRCPRHCHFEMRRTARVSRNTGAPVMTPSVPVSQKRCHGKGRRVLLMVLFPARNRHRAAPLKASVPGRLH